jgi:hypothetical protein
VTTWQLRGSYDDSHGSHWRSTDRALPGRHLALRYLALRYLALRYLALRYLALRYLALRYLSSEADGRAMEVRLNRRRCDKPL